LSTWPLGQAKTAAVATDRVTDCFVEPTMDAGHRAMKSIATTRGDR
jgi:hypothetical protein